MAKKKGPRLEPGAKKTRASQGNKLPHGVRADKATPSTPEEALDRIIDALDGQREGNEWRCRCPLHDGHAMFTSVKGQKLVVHCHACGPERQDELIAELKRSDLWYGEPEAIMPVPDNAPAFVPPRDAIGHWEYRDSEGRLLCVQVQTRKVKALLWLYYSNNEWSCRHHPPAPKPLYGLDRLAAQPGALVLVSEGPKKADAARELFDNVVGIAWMGGAKGYPKCDWKPLKGRDVVIWPDADAIGLDAAFGVAQTCLDIGATSVRVVDLPEGVPQGWDLYDALQDGTDLDLAAMVASAKPFTPKHAALTPEFVYVTKPDAFYHLPTRDMLNVEQMDREHMAMMDGEKISRILLKDKRFKRVRNLTYAPGQPVPFAMEDGQEKLNTYQPNSIAPAPGDVTPYLEYMAYMCIRQAERKVMEQWLAYHEQRPGEKILWAPLLVGARQGTGKTTMFLITSAVLGARNVRKITGDALTASFNGWARDVQVVAIEEVMAKGKFEIYNTLKDFITATTMHINEKHVNGYDQPHRVNLFLTSNHEDDAVFVEESDRRLFVVQAPEQLHSDPDFYKRLYAWLAKPESVAALRHYLRQVDLTDFPAKDHAPQTEAKRNMVMASKHPAAEFLQRKFDNQEWPMARPLIEPGHLLEAMPYRFERFREHQLRKFLTAIGAEPAKLQARRSDGTKYRVWIIRDHAKWRAASPKELDAGYDQPLRDGVYRSNMRGQPEWKEPAITEKKPKAKTKWKSRKGSAF